MSKGSHRRPTNAKTFSSNYDSIKWTKEEDEEFDSIQNRISSQRALADKTNPCGDEKAGSSIRLAKDSDY